jgi:activator of 2-hydroxyglutaryl-CoA dehydratase
MYPFSERTQAGELLTRLEALITIVKRRWILERTVQEGLTAGIDSGSTTTKAVIMQDDEILGATWSPSREVVKTAEKVYAEALKIAGVKREDIEALGTTGYGRHTLGDHFKADLVQEELTVNSKAAMYLAGIEKGEAMIIDIGGMDNKIITANNGIPDNFTMGGICAGASVKEQLLQEIDLRQPAIEVGGTALVEGVPVEMNNVLGFEVIVPKYPQYIGAVGGALLSSSFR